VADSFDPYREALVMEEQTSWSEDFDDLEPGEKSLIEISLHADPENCSQLEYVRTHTGFCRTVIVTADDIARVSQ
jgi:hypothetical protein|tara:strand:+ start:197 stop:421 length:225 start_codon:yes stop_codon:yes gene_type:complete